MLRPLSVLWRELHERLGARTGCPVLAGEQDLLKSADWSDDDLAHGRDDRFLALLKRYREWKSKDQPMSSAAGVSQRGPGEERPVAMADELEEKRAQVLSRQMARTAEGTREVRKTRESLFGDPWRRLLRTEAEALLRSHAPRFLSKEEFDRLGIPLLAHEATVGDQLIQRVFDGVSESFDLTIRWASGLVTLPQQVTWKGGNRRVLRFPDADFRRSQMSVLPGSCFDVLRTAAKEISAPFELQEEDASWFVLTGQFPVIRGLRVSRRINLSHRGWFEFATITLTAQPFVSATTVAATFAREQRDLLGHRMGRQFAESNLELLNFVRQRIQAPGTPLSALLDLESGKWLLGMATSLGNDSMAGVVGGMESHREARMEI